MTLFKAVRVGAFGAYVSGLHLCMDLVVSTVDYDHRHVNAHRPVWVVGAMTPGKIVFTTPLSRLILPVYAALML